MKNFLYICALICSGFGFAQEYFPANEGVKTVDSNYRAFTGATIQIDPQTQVTDATLLIYQGKVVAAGKNVKLPKNTVIESAEGLYIYPSFIDAFSTFGVKKPKSLSSGGRSPQYDPTREGFYWNDHIRSEVKAVDHFEYAEKEAKQLREAGIGVVNTHHADGIARGTGLTVILDDKTSMASRILDAQSSAYFSFQKSVQSRQSYPTSLMGAMALLRQLNHDLKWYQTGASATRDRALEALSEQQNLPQFFEAGGNGNAVRALKIGKQFGKNMAVLGGGDEHEFTRELKSLGGTVFVPLNFPKAYDVADPYFAEYVNLRDMRHWHNAPSNAKVLADNGIRFAFTAHGLSSAKDLIKNVSKTIERGLSAQDALAALTTVPAELLGKQNSIGALKPQMQANFIISSGPIFDSNSILYEHWVGGHQHIIEDRSIADVRGTYTLRSEETNYTLSLEGTLTKPSLKVTAGEEKLKSKVSYKDHQLQFSVFNDSGTLLRFAGTMSAIGLQGKFIDSNGNAYEQTLERDSLYVDSKKAKEVDSNGLAFYQRFPNVGYGAESLPQSKEWIFKNATVWTGEEVLNETDVHIKDGKIFNIGKGLTAKRATEVDATGKHLTAGIIDEHTHIGALAINEAGHNSTAEVRMSDVVDPKDLDLYRNLAGGVTSAQLLHGSANPIGGQSAIIRLKWGETADNLLFEGAPGFIKFALGENVKQSNWESYNRFPQTRMGVEQVFVDYFNRAKEYQQLKASKKAYRYDEELETLVEIIESRRFISSHSYVQSEINMLMKVAESFDFRVNTFTHILEGYKVADKMAAHGVGGSTFSDWWAYKYEVKDAIPYNAAIMASQGVTVAINSDDAEMSRRLNQEAAKTIKYGGMSEIEAWKTVTLNPAKLLHIDHKVGSIAVGKEADVVLWTDHPMSIYSKAQKTLIQGAEYFDLEKDKALREAMKAERIQLTKLMLEVKESGGEVVTPVQTTKERFTCDTL